MPEDNDNWEDENEDDLDEDEYVEQVCDVVCPHCRQPLQLVLGPVDENEELDDEDEL